jgi:branched-chain amino acid aminotransferase
MRVCIVKNKGTVFVGPGVEKDFDLVAMTTNLANWGDSVRLGVVLNGRFAASPYARTKVLSWAFNLNWYQEAHERGFDEVVLLNERQEVAECTSANIFAAFGDQVVTPPLDSGCLPGITRDILLHDIRLPGIRMAEGRITPSDLERADEIFITSTTRDVLPVAEIEGIHVNRTGKVCDRLKQAIREFIDQYSAAKAVA